MNDKDAAKKPAATLCPVGVKDFDLVLKANEALGKANEVFNFPMLRKLACEEYQQVTKDELIAYIFDLANYAKDVTGGFVMLAHAHSNEALEELLNDALATSRKFMATRAAEQRLKKDSDGKQAAKQRARELWDDWQAGRARHKSGAAFARHVAAQLPVESERSVEKWMRQWRSEKAHSAS